ncbi:hypothetical protein GGTG_11485 [Gaeumannomyces tritici R3-111a-1]|uniref:Uncharacterized protein n=1 Tax=Gaeumannomyces tritici (strain R3-111a-1) TaxID=644352 RepID=J3PDB7_GAET3|nr:hypothetical protein GGTG_11485 [Gaeumannomyces tritici R3-111a-1]EJT70462.1 hypothetical protein GGTG_11485 [Gaeumannomyces tritici R3-111a-1]
MRTHRDADYVSYHASEAVGIHARAPPDHDDEHCGNLVTVAQDIADRCSVFEKDPDDDVGTHQDRDCCAAAVPEQGY